MANCDLLTTDAACKSTAPGANGLAKILDEIGRCTRCASDLPLGPRPVLQCAPGATILIAGQAPGRRVHASGLPFDDASGDRLRAWMGIDRNTFYDPSRIAILPMGFCYPGTAARGDLPPRPECAATWRAALLARLPRLRLTLLLGSYAQAWHLADDARSLTERVSDWRLHWPQTIPLPHPSPRNNLWLKRNPWFESELLPPLRARVDELMHQPELNRKMP